MAHGVHCECCEPALPNNNINNNNNKNNIIFSSGDDRGLLSSFIVFQFHCFGSFLFCYMTALCWTTSGALDFPAFSVSRNSTEA